MLSGLKRRHQAKGSIPHYLVENVVIAFVADGRRGKALALHLEAAMLALEVIGMIFFEYATAVSAHGDAGPVQDPYTTAWALARVCGARAVDRLPCWSHSQGAVPDGFAVGDFF